MSNLEYRSFQLQDNTIDEEKHTVRGLAIPVESRSELLGGMFYETIKRSAVDEDLIKSNDVKLYINHDSSQGTFARSKFGKGTLKLSITERGLEYEAKLGNTERAKELLEGIERGDYDAVSFAMCVSKDEWKENNDGTYSRSISKLSVLDEISILSQLPAYSATDVTCRSLEDFKKEQEEIREKETLERIKEYDEMISEIDKLNIDIDFNK